MKIFLDNRNLGGTETDPIFQSWLNSQNPPTLTDGKFLVGNASNVATEVTMSGDATMTNAGVVTIADLDYLMMISQRTFFNF